LASRSHLCIGIRKYPSFCTQAFGVHRSAA
jgi:hypothetical protein